MGIQIFENPILLILAVAQFVIPQNEAILGFERQFVTKSVDIVQ